MESVAPSWGFLWRRFWAAVRLKFTPLPDFCPQCGEPMAWNAAELGSRIIGGWECETLACRLPTAQQAMTPARPPRITDGAVISPLPPIPNPTLSFGPELPSTVTTAEAAEGLRRLARVQAAPGGFIKKHQVARVQARTGTATTSACGPTVEGLKRLGRARAAQAYRPPRRIVWGG